MRQRSSKLCALHVTCGRQTSFPIVMCGKTNLAINLGLKMNFRWTKSLVFVYSACLYKMLPQPQSIIIFLLGWWDLSVCMFMVIYSNVKFTVFLPCYPPIKEGESSTHVTCIAQQGQNLEDHLLSLRMVILAPFCLSMGKGRRKGHPLSTLLVEGDKVQAHPPFSPQRPPQNVV